ncbi:acetylornithine transaminase [Gryllotalpicola ginsengisoli]|uniref:acetylornithine transaminase n=1 Tax=Gryllotalpicola ginsengisoli TaxID=444608 RepID=UPI0003B4DF6A|nr:acetylornithine transaminase [Gryllotalpicola ginsengisoli]
MSATTGEWAARYDADLMKTFGTPPLLLDHGQGAWVWDADGNAYLDFLAGIAVNALGHAHPALIAAISAQAEKLVHVSNLFASLPQLELARTLKRLAGTGDEGRVFFANSGTEANEAAFKLARLNRGDDGRKTRILALNGGFHGRTMGALALTGKAYLRAPFEPMPGGVEYLDATIDALESAVDDTVAALFVEPLQGEAGVVELPEGFLAEARRITARHGALLIVDEVQTGVGRTGEWFGFQHSGITPDAITLAKGLAGGVPIGALVTFGAAGELLGRGQHGSTFGGNPLATAAALAVVGEIEASDLVANARARGAELRRVVTGLGSPLIAGLSGAGLLIGVKLTAPVAEAVVASAREHGLIINATGPDRLRLAPPLIIGEAEVREFRDRFAASLAAVSSDADRAEVTA